MELSSEKNNKLFPTTQSLIIFWLYITLFVSQGLLVTDVERSKIHGFNPIVAVLLTELVKLLTCIAVYFLRSQGNLLVDMRNNYRLLILYFIPSFLYCIYNNLTYINLELFDVTTYYCLMQFRIVLTAIIYQILFKRRLTKTQWLSLVILTFGCLIKEFAPNENLSKQRQTRATGVNASARSNVTASVLTTAHIPTDQFDLINFQTNHIFWLPFLLLLQMFCSCFAGVYTEFLLKDSSTSNNTDVILQNIFMYLDSILCNLIVFNATNSIEDTTKIRQFSETIQNLWSKPITLLLVLNNALSGLVASFFLKSLNSILKTFASAIELFAIALFAWILFNVRVDMSTITALFFVSAAMIVYSKNPVSVAPPRRTGSIQGQDNDGFMLIPTEEQD